MSVPGAAAAAGGERGAAADAGPTELLALPELPAPDPESLVLADPVPPADGRPCGNPTCRRKVGAPFGELPARPVGFCRNCGTRYSLLPQLRAGETLDGGRYTVRGPIAHGGLGWVYLAVDSRLNDRPIALKGVLNPHDHEARTAMLAERDRMIAIDDRAIARIYDYVTHPPEPPRPEGPDVPDGAAGPDGPDGRRGPAIDYIVMEFIGGKSLRTVVREAAAGRRPLGADTPLALEHVARYGCQILAALRIVHGRGLVYADLKPDNVIHQGREVVLIDLGGAQPPEDRSRVPVITLDYAAPEVVEGGPPSVAHDIHTVGKTLEELARAVEAPREPGLGEASFDRVVRRACRRDPSARFATADEMAEQLEGVLRELISLRTGRPATKPSVVFAPSHALLDAGLGAVPGVERWRDRPPQEYRAPGPVRGPELADGRPGPSQVAVGLPVPYPDPGDPAIVQLRLPAPETARGVIRQLERFRGAEDGEPAERRTGRESVEVLLGLCRAHLRLRHELAGEDAAGEDAAGAEAERARAHELRQARARLAEAEAILGRQLGRPRDPALVDWRLSWHHGLLALAAGDVPGAERHFEAVCDALPGEYPAKLALGYCAEWRGDPAGALPFYRAVWQRNTQQTSAAFGMARIHLAGGRRAEAARVLGGVPPLSRHYDAARIAALRIRAARLPDPGRPAGAGTAAGAAPGPRSAPDAGPGPDAGSAPEAVGGRAREGALPEWESLARAGRDLASLDLDGGAPSGAERVRLTAEVRAWALDLVSHAERSARRRREGGPAAEWSPEWAAQWAAAGSPFTVSPGRPPTEDGLRLLLAESLLRLARLPDTSPADQEHLVDCANAVHPRSWFVRRRIRRPR